MTKISLDIAKQLPVWYIKYSLFITLLLKLTSFQRFNCNIFEKESVNNSKPKVYCCCAIGSRDRSISVWLTSLKRPLVVIKELFDDSVLDISWSSNGLYLLACSWDGTVACVMFTQEEIGTPLSMDKKV